MLHSLRTPGSLKAAFLYNMPAGVLSQSGSVEGRESWNAAFTLPGVHIADA
jgi:hypothetical protein